MTIQTLEDLFVHEISDIYNAERQITKALPKMAKAATDEELRAAFSTHLDETEEQVKRLEQVAALLGIDLEDETCEAMEGLVKEGEEVIGEVEKGPVLDAALIAAAQKVEHYEISGYGTLIALAAQLGYDDAISLLEMTLEEESDTDEKLTSIAEGGINEEAHAAHA